MSISGLISAFNDTYNIWHIFHPLLHQQKSRINTFLFGGGYISITGLISASERDEYKKKRA